MLKGFNKRLKENYTRAMESRVNSIKTMQESIESTRTTGLEFIKIEVENNENKKINLKNEFDAKVMELTTKLREDINTLDDANKVLLDAKVQLINL